MDQFAGRMLELLNAHIERHPQAQAQDALKFVFQGMLGVGHLLGQPEAVEKYVCEEMHAQQSNGDEALIESLSPAWCRLNLRPAAKAALTPRLIARLMLGSAPNTSFDRADVANAVRALRRDGYAPLNRLNDDDIDRVERVDWLPSHSETYRAAYHPSYRVIAADWEPLMPAICAVAARMSQQRRVLVTLDGPCASGKTTLAARLADVFEAEVLHTDDFVVPHPQKTPERLSIPGGNCDWERLTAEALAPWKDGQNPPYREYDFRHDEMRPPQILDAERIVILEGSYCNLPAIRALADVRLYMDTPDETRMARLKERESPESLRGFFERWSPLENAYYTAYNLPDDGCIRVRAREADS
ncbi:MAG: hypothetical protein IJJ23_02410 [Clostridia bacterium]|nr:hypothetical protein [Clostridia bacterium]